MTPEQRAVWRMNDRSWEQAMLADLAAGPQNDDALLAFLAGGRDDA